MLTAHNSHVISSVYKREFDDARSLLGVMMMSTVMVVMMMPPVAAGQAKDQNQCDECVS
jgi:hypothetical protein